MQATDVNIPNITDSNIPHTTVTSTQYFNNPSLLIEGMECVLPSLNLTSLVRLSLCNRKFYQIISQDDSLWKKVFTNLRWNELTQLLIEHNLCRKGLLGILNDSTNHKLWMQPDLFHESLHKAIAKIAAKLDVNIFMKNLATYKINEEDVIKFCLDIAERKDGYNILSHLRALPIKDKQSLDNIEVAARKSYSKEHNGHEVSHHSYCFLTF